MRSACLLIVALLSACVIAPGDHRVDAHWTFERLEGGEIGCPAGWATAVLVTTETDQPEVRSEARFPCAENVGTSQPLAEGTYVAWLEIRDPQDRVVTTSLRQSVEVGSVATPLDARIYVDAGYVQAAWSWKNGRWCDDGVNPFQVITLSLTGPSGTNQIFSCHDDAGITVPLAPGPYSVSIGQGFSRQRLPDIVVEAPNRVTVLPEITL